jgi:hypothetical protein
VRSAGNGLLKYQAQNCLHLQTQRVWLIGLAPVSWTVESLGQGIWSDGFLPSCLASFFCLVSRSTTLALWPGSFQRCTNQAPSCLDHRLVWVAVAKLMAELGWSAVRVRGLTRCERLEQV